MSFSLLSGRAPSASLEPMLVAPWSGTGHAMTRSAKQGFDAGQIQNCYGLQAGVKAHGIRRLNDSDASPILRSIGRPQAVDDLSIPFSTESYWGRQPLFVLADRNIFRGISMASAWPHREAGFDEPLEVFARSARAGLDRHSLHQRVEQAGQSLDVDVRRDIALGLGALHPIDQCNLGDLAAREHLFADALRVLSARHRRDHAEAAVRLVAIGEIVHASAEQHFGHAPRGRLSQRRADIIHLLALVEVERLAEQGFLVAECGVEAGPGDPHGIGEIGHRGALVALAPEDSQSLGKRLLHAKFARPASCYDGFDFIHIGWYIIGNMKISRLIFTMRGSAGRSYPIRDSCRPPSGASCPSMPADLRVSARWRPPPRPAAASA